MRKHHRLHRFVISAARTFLSGWIARRFSYIYERQPLPDYPCIVLSNHVTTWDPIYLGMSFAGHMYFVANEFVLRIRRFGGLIRLCFGPIVRVKTRTEARAAIEILRTLKDGHNVCIFAEGGTSWNGETRLIPPATAKLVKKSGAGLITFRLEGAYLTFPRWAKSRRLGKMYGGVQRILSPAELEAMSVEEIDKLINADLYTNDFDNRRLDGIKYIGENPAEDLEVLLFLCPQCYGISTLHSEGEALRCQCGLHLHYNEVGHFEGETEAPFTTILDWDRWQRQQIQTQKEQLLSLDAHKIITSDDRLLFREIRDNQEAVPLGNGSMQLSRAELRWQLQDGSELTFPLADITDIAVSRRCRLSFSSAGKEYEVDAEDGAVYAAIKYALYGSVLTKARIML